MKGGRDHPIGAISFEARWVMAARAGYDLAFQELMNRNQDRVYQYAFHVFRDQQVAEEILLSTFARARAQLQEFRLGTCFSDWLLRICAREAWHRIREKLSDESRPELLAETEGRGTPNDPVRDRSKQGYAASQHKHILADGFRTLTPLDRMIFLLGDVEKCSPEEVADLLGLPVAAVRSGLLQAEFQIHEASEAGHIGNPRW
jgi:RNA polymerase sigma factor (sigma-70 family)